MKNLKTILTWTPEIYLILASIYYWVMTGILINLIAIGLIVVLILQILLENKKMGLVISILFIVLSLFMLLALFSEFSEFSTVTLEANRLIIIGSIFLVHWGRDSIGAGFNGLLKN